jgi:hypothetical protein
MVWTKRQDCEDSCSLQWARVRSVFTGQISSAQTAEGRQIGNENSKAV